MIRLLSLTALLLIPIVGQSVGVLDNGVYKDADGTVVPAPMSENVKLVPPPAGGILRTDIKTDGTRFHVGDSLPIQFAVNHKSYVWIFNTDTNGRMVQVFPNYYDRSNLIEPGKTYNIPDSNYQMTVTGARGTNRLQIVAVSSEYDLPIFAEWRAYTQADPYPATPVGAKGLMQQIDTMCRKATVMSQSPEVLHPQIPKDIYATKTASYYVMERAAGESAEYRVPRYGKIAVNSYPTNGRVYMDGLYVGRTPQVVDRVAAGEHKIKIMKEGYTPYECNYSVDPNTMAQVEAFLKETPVEPGYSIFKKIF